MAGNAGPRKTTAKKKPPARKPAAKRAPGGERPKAIVFLVDEIPHVAAMADAFAIPAPVRRSPMYFYESHLHDQVTLPPDRVCPPDETKIGLAFLWRLTVDLATRTWKGLTFPLNHQRSWHDVPIDVLVKALERCGFDVVRAPEVMEAAGIAAETAAAAKLAKRALTAPPSDDLVFADLFGLTRVAADGTIRTDPKLAGSALSADRDGRVGLLRKQDGRVRTLVGLAEAKTLGVLDQGRLMHPAGSAVLDLRTGFQLDALKADGSPGAGQFRRNVYDAAAPARDPVRLGGGDSIDFACGERVAFDAAGNWVAWLDTEMTPASWTPVKRGVLCGGSFPTPDSAPTVAWRADLSGPAHAQLSLSIADGVPVACLREVATSKVHVAILGDGAARVRTIDSVIAPARVGQTLVYQPDEGTVVREPLAGGRSARHALPAKHVGRGRVVARGDRWLFVPTHGETVLDLEQGRELDRGLPADQAQGRAKGLELLAQVSAVAADAGMEAHLTELDATRPSYGLWFAGGGPVLGRVIPHALLQNNLLTGRASISIGGGYSSAIDRPVTSDELLELLRFLDRHALKLESAVSFFSSLHEYPMSFRTPPAPALIEPAAEALLLWAALDEVAPAPGSFESKLAEWTKRVPMPDEIGARLATVDENNAGWRFQLLAAIAWMTVSRFRGAALDAWLQVPEPRLRFMGASSALTWLAKNDDGARKQLARWFNTIERPHTNWKPLADVLGATVESDDEDEEKEREPVAPPVGFAKPTTWDAIAQAWAGAREVHGLADQARAADPAAVAQKLGIPAFPPSYLEFIRRFYPLGELRQRYTRDKFTYFLDVEAPVRLVESRDIYQQGLAVNAEFSASFHEELKYFSGLLPFGSNTSRTWICWDPKQTRADGEMLICFIDGDQWSVETARADVGYDLKEIVKYYQPGTLDERA